MILAQIRTAKDCITFIERIYEKKDPKYADFSIRQQQEILRRLNEELKGSECFLAASGMSGNQGVDDRVAETNLKR